MILECYEYIWDIKRRLDEAIYNDLCLNGGFGQILPIGIGARDALPGEFPHMVRLFSLQTLRVSDELVALKPH